MHTPHVGSVAMEPVTAPALGLQRQYQPGGEGWWEERPKQRPESTDTRPVQVSPARLHGLLNQ